MDSFLVQVWHPGAPVDALGGAGLRGIVRHIGSGRETRFSAPDELVAFLSELVARSPVVTVSADPVPDGGPDGPGG